MLFCKKQALCQNIVEENGPCNRSIFKAILTKKLMGADNNKKTDYYNDKLTCLVFSSEKKPIQFWK